MDKSDMKKKDYRKGEKSRLRLNIRRRKCNNLNKWRMREASRLSRLERNVKEEPSLEENPSNQSDIGINQFVHVDEVPYTSQEKEAEGSRRNVKEEPSLEEDPSNQSDIGINQFMHVDEVPYTSQENSVSQISGKRIVDIQLFLKSIVEFPHLAPFSCSSKDLFFASEIRDRNTSHSILVLSCRSCNANCNLSSEDPSQKECHVNTAIVTDRRVNEFHPPDKSAKNDKIKDSPFEFIACSYNTETLEQTETVMNKPGATVVGVKREILEEEFENQTVAFVQTDNEANQDNYLTDRRKEPEENVGLSTTIQQAKFIIKDELIVEEVEVKPSIYIKSEHYD